MNKQPRKPWTFALEIKGVKLDTLPMERLGAYMRHFAALLGPDARATLASVTAGSVVLRARDHAEHPAVTRQHVVNAANDCARPYETLRDDFARDGAWGRVVNKQRQTIITFARSAAPRATEGAIVREAGEVDGVVVAVEGKDSTMHIRVRDPVSGLTTSAHTTDPAIARKAGSMFRGDVVRLRVHGAWRRTDAGWVGEDLRVDELIELDQRTPLEVMEELRGLKSGWSGLTKEQSDALLHKMRYGP